MTRNSVIGFVKVSFPKTVYNFCVSDDKNDLENHKNVLSKEIMSTVVVLNIIDTSEIGDKNMIEASEDIQCMLHEYADMFATDNSVHTSLPGA